MNNQTNILLLASIALLISACAGSGGLYEPCRRWS